MKKKTESIEQKPKVNPELEGFDIHIDSFGEIRSNFEIDKLTENWVSEHCFIQALHRELFNKIFPLSPQVTPSGLNTLQCAIS